MNVVFSPIKVSNIAALNTLKGGDTFVFFTPDIDFVAEISAGNVYMVVKDGAKEGSCKVINLVDGLTLSRDSDRKVIKVQTTLNVTL